MRFPGKPIVVWNVPALIVFAALAVALAEERADQAAKIQQLIEELGDEDYFVRQRAQAELEEFSFEAFDALSAATTHRDLEIAARAKYLLGLMQVEWFAKDAPADVKKILTDYDTSDAASKRMRISLLAKLPDGQGIDALCRVVRFEKSPVLSKHAAVELLGLGPNHQPPAQASAERLRTNLADNRRTAAVWISTWLRFRDDPKTAIVEWTKLVETEHGLLKSAPSRTTAAIVARLIRFQVEWLKKLDQKDQAMAALPRLIDLEKGDTKDLAELLDWLIEQKAWSAVDELASRFSLQFGRSPILLYTLAQAQAEQGDQEQAEQTAARATKLYPGKDQTQLLRHVNVGYKLEKHGLHRWAEKEYRQVIETGRQGNGVEDVVIMSQFYLSEMLHDQAEHHKAAEVLQKLVDAQPKDTSARKRLGGQFGIRRTLGTTRARMDFFRACHFRVQEDPVKQRAHLDRAVAADETDVDVLIACYQLPDQPPEYREKMRVLIKKSAARFRQEMAAGSDDPTPYNQFAWLIGNTEGDFDEAIELSKKSIELGQRLGRNVGGFYDTLAHVYFAKGDYENAAKTQLKAAELEPHSGLVARKLEVFQKKWEETKQ